MDLTSKDSHQSIRCEYINIMNSNNALAGITQYKRPALFANKQTSHNLKNKKHCWKRLRNFIVVISLTNSISLYY